MFWLEDEELKLQYLEMTKICPGLFDSSDKALSDMMLQAISNCNQMRMYVEVSFTSVSGTFNDGIKCNAVLEIQSLAMFAQNFTSCTPFSQLC